MIESFLENLLKNSRLFLGEIVVTTVSQEQFRIMHRSDLKSGALAEKLQIFSRPTDAREIAKFDQSGQFRPLKGAPNLRHGWQIHLQSIKEVHEALDYFYPGAIATWLAYRDHQFNPVDLRETLNRQSGMYRVTRNLSDKEADKLIGSFCEPVQGCLRKIVWKINANCPIQSLPQKKFDLKESIEFPYLCTEACNLLVAAARKVVKKSS
jgi:sirohydrochlorin cobaltochelatase